MNHNTLGPMHDDQVSKPRRLASFIMSGELLLDFLKHGVPLGQGLVPEPFSLASLRGLPPDARLLSIQPAMHVSYGHLSLHIIVESDAFPPCIPGVVPPQLTLSFTRHYSAEVPSGQGTQS